MNRRIAQLSAAAFGFAALTLSAPFASAAPRVTTTPPAGSVCLHCSAPNATAVPMPPRGFNPVTATDQQLSLFGFPPRPDATKASEAYVMWKKAMLAAPNRIVPKLQATNISNGPIKFAGNNAFAGANAADRSARALPTAVTSPNWSGYVVNNPMGPFKQAGTYVYGSFIVPSAQQANGACDGGWDDSSQWVGIDGYGSPDVLQAGIEADAYCANGMMQTFYSPWYEWYPFNEVRITNMFIGPGDLIYVYVWADSTTVGHYYIADQTTGQSSTLVFNAPSGTALKGNSIEWIVERPESNGTLTTLTNYTTDPWYGCHGLTKGTKLFSPGQPQAGTAYSVTMLDNSSNPISYGLMAPNNALTYVGPGAQNTMPGSALWFFDEGSAQ